MPQGNLGHFFGVIQNQKTDILLPFKLIKQSNLYSLSLGEGWGEDKQKKYFIFPIGITNLGRTARELSRMFIKKKYFVIFYLYIFEIKYFILNRKNQLLSY